MCYSNLTVLMDMFKITESSLSNHKIRVYEQCEPTCVGACNVFFKYNRLHL